MLLRPKEPEEDRAVCSAAFSGLLPWTTFVLFLYEMLLLGIARTADHLTVNVILKADDSCGWHHFR